MKTITITQRDGTRHEVLVDDQDYPEVSQYKWSVTRPPSKHAPHYAVRWVRQANGKQGCIRLHRAIIGEQNIPVGGEIDHRNGKGLDCRRRNLRVCESHADNQKNIHKHKPNKSGIRSVYKLKGREWWQAVLTIAGERVLVGNYTTPEEAEQAAHDPITWAWRQDQAALKRLQDRIRALLAVA